VRVTTNEIVHQVTVLPPSAPGSTGGSSFRCVAVLDAANVVAKAALKALLESSLRYHINIYARLTGTVKQVTVLPPSAPGSTSMSSFRCVAVLDAADLVAKAALKALLESSLWYHINTDARLTGTVKQVTVLPPSAPGGGNGAFRCVAVLDAADVVAKAALKALSRAAIEGETEVRAIRGGMAGGG
jgi:hypothetical protein